MVPDANRVEGNASRLEAAALSSNAERSGWRNAVYEFPVSTLSRQHFRAFRVENNNDSASTAFSLLPSLGKGAYQV